MAKISSTIELQDRMSQPLNNIVNSMQSAVNVANKLNDTAIDFNVKNAQHDISGMVAQLQDLQAEQQKISNISSDLCVVPDKTRKEIREAAHEVERLKAALEYANPSDDTYNLQIQSIEKSMDKLKAKQESLLSSLAGDFQNTGAQPTWTSNNFDVFSTTGAERYAQEIQSLNTYMQQLYGTQQQITQQAQNTDLFPDNMVADLNTLQGKIEAIRAKIQQIENNPLNVASDSANAQLEQLRNQLHQMTAEQNELNSAVANMDVSSANSAYQRLSSTVANTERYIRDNTDAQGQFTSAIQESTAASSNLMSSIKGLIAAYATVQSAKKVIDISDTLTQTTARLNMMNDGLQTTEQLQQMIYAAAERSRGSYQATADAVSKMGIMARDAFNSNAELVAFSEQLNKQFTIAGTSAEGVSAAMLQLTQAMGSGVLRGEELNSVFEQAPTIIQTIADYLNVPIGQIRAMAQEGQLSATVVKNALLTAADETNAKFESMPKTFGQIWTSMKNQALMAFQPILQRLNQIANSKAFNQFVNSAVGALSQLANVLTTVFDMVVKVGSFISENWSLIAPIVYGIVGAVVAYNAALAINNAIQGISNFQKKIEERLTYNLVKAKIEAAGATYAGIAALQGEALARQLAIIGITEEQFATYGATTAQNAFNAALYACPLTWIILAIIAVIALIYIVIGVINKVCDTQISATGVIMGTLATIGAYLFNCIAYWWNIISAFIEFFVNVWKNPEYAFKAFVVNIANAFLNFCLAIVQGNGAAIGVIVGAWYAFCQIIHNIIAAVYNFFAAGIEAIVNGWNQCVYAVQCVLYNIADAAFNVAQGAANSFDAAASSIANAFIGAANTAISAINSIINVLNKIPGISIGTVSKLSTVSYHGAGNAVAAAKSNLSRPTAPTTFSLNRMDIGSISDAYNAGNQAGQDFAAGFEGTVANIQAGMQDWLGEKPEDYWEAPKLDYINLGDAAKAGYNFGSGIEDKLSNFGIGNTEDIQNALNDIAGNTADGADGAKDAADKAGKAAEKLDCTDEELKYLRDIAERDVINRFTTAELKVEFHNENNINSDLDIDGVVDTITEKVSEQLEIVAEGVYT